MGQSSLFFILSSLRWHLVSSPCGDQANQSDQRHGAQKPGAREARLHLFPGPMQPPLDTPPLPTTPPAMTVCKERRKSFPAIFFEPNPPRPDSNSKMAGNYFRAKSYRHRDEKTMSQVATFST